MSLVRDTLEGFAGEPRGRFVAGATFAHFCARADLWGVVLWGRPEPEHIATLVTSLRLELGEAASRHGSIVDASRLDSVDVAAFSVLDRYVREHQDELAKQVSRLALVRPEGMTGAVVAGFFEVLPRPYPVGVFASSEEALAWLDLAEEDAAAFVRAIEVLHGEATGAAPVVTALATVLDARLGDINVAEAARALGLSERTLQRRLRGARTTFLDELNLARLRAAKRLLLDSDTPVTTIALEVGCATPQHFSTLFRRLTGQTPSDWRRAQRTPG